MDWLRLFALALALSLALASLARGAQQHTILQDAREVIQVDHAPEGLVWVVQLSDLHISSYHADRAQSLETFLGPLLALIKPALVLITGDLTDAKSKDRISRRQDEAEWVQYSQTMNKVIADSGLPQHAFYDLRGNHDNYGVPEVGGALDYFSKYSISATMNRTSTVQSVTVMSRGWKHLFVGMDSSMSIGLRGPCNVFGHPTDQQLQKVDLELSQWDTCSPENITKVVFGHFPMSFTASSETRKRPEPIFAKHSISAYVCGHLHTNFGTNLFKHHLHLPARLGTSNSCASKLQAENGEFWEWETGDWRMCRIVRIIAIDEGHTSFVDLEFSNFNASLYDARNQLPTVVIPTYPLDSEKMQRSSTLPTSSSHHDSVRALVFSPHPLVSVVAKFFDTITGQLVLLEELEMHSSSKAGVTGLLYVTTWNSTKYLDHSPIRYMLQIVVVDSRGKETHSPFRPFSVTNMGRLKHTWREFFVMGFVWDEVFPILVSSAFAALVSMFIFPKLYFHFLVKSGYYNRWVFSLFRADSKQKFTAQKAFEFFMWFFIQGCGNGAIWWGQLLTVAYLIFFPWFWGQVLAEGYPIGYMSVWGWTVQAGGNSPSQGGLGWPDLMVIVLPYFYLVLLPLFTLIFALSAERSLREFHALDAPPILKKKEQGEASKAVKGNSSSSSTPLGDKDQQSLSNQGISSRLEFKPLDSGLHKEWKCTSWLRIVLIAGCMSVSFIHFGQTYAVVGAYGIISLLASPGFAWPVPLLMVAAILQTKAFRKNK